MSEFLSTIIGHVREETQRRRRQVSESALRERALFHAPTRGFAQRLRGDSRRIIAEVKRASPSKGLLRGDFDPIEIARELANHGASALSVLTEERFFQGSLLHLEQIKREVALPLLRKDFILDRYQLIEARSYGADAVLLIAAAVDPTLLDELQEEANSLSLDTLVEVHTERELERALRARCHLIGINNRDLKTFEISLATTERLAPLIPAGMTAVCESGIDNLEQIDHIESLGIHVFLIGESLMRASHPGAKLKELLQGTISQYNSTD
jgi:indole-3-glycerol phosphate synthase